MIQFYAIGLLIATVGGLIIGDVIFDQDSKFEGDDDDVDPVTDDNVVNFNGSEKLVGTERNDLVPPGQDASLAPDEISLMGGNDTATIEQPGILVKGGDGNDTLQSTVAGNKLLGENGDDTLTGVEGDRMSGGMGVDTLNINRNFSATTLATVVNGDEGNDVLNVKALAGVDAVPNDQEVVSYSGDAGNDSFNFTLDVKDQLAASGTGASFTTSLGKVLDFNPAEDKLSIDIQNGAANADRGYSVALDQIKTPDGLYRTDVNITFEATDTAHEAVSSLRVVSPTAFALEDIDFGDGVVPPVTVVPPNMLKYDGEDELIGTNGVDIVEAGQNPELAPDVIRLGEGDDQAVVGAPGGITVFGGDGNDVLQSTAVANKLRGGAGDDTLTAIDGNSLEGGDGNDILNNTQLAMFSSKNALIDGGAGNDTINTTANAGIAWQSGSGNVEYAGGEGVDNINITLKVQDVLDPTAAAGAFDTSIGEITGFDPATEKLTVEIDRTAGDATRAYSIDFNQTQVEGVYVTDVTINFAATATANAASTSAKITSTAPFTVNDIVLVETPAPATA